MNIPKIFRRVFAILLIVVWGGYALLNLTAQLQNLQRGYSDGWDFSSRLDGVLASANGSVLFQPVFQDANALAEQALGKKTSNDYSLVRADNGQYMYSAFYTYEAYDYSQQALQLREAQRAALQSGGAFVYLNAIDLYIDGAGDYGRFPVSNLNPRADAFLAQLNGYGVASLDARATLAASGLEPAAYRYNTEPHWTIEAAFEVYLGLAVYLQAQGVDIDPNGTSADGFTASTYAGQYVGELGKRVGIPNTEAEDFTLITPAFETDFTLSYLEGDPHTARSGSFDTVLLDDYWLLSDAPYERNFYNAYLSGEYGYRLIRNNQNTGGARILIIGDSYMLPVATFLATAVSEVHLVWPYSLPGEANLPDFLSENAFDGVVVGMSPSSLSNSGFNYLQGIELPQSAIS